MKIIKLIVLVVVLTGVQKMWAQERVTLTLQQAIEVAGDSSLNAFIAKNSYLSSYWSYRTFKAERLPSLSFSSTPIQYYQTFVKRYDSQNNVDVYMPQKNLYSSGGLSVRQNVDATGGVFSLETNLDYLRNFGEDKSTQYSSVPFRMGYSQSLFGYNSFKWDKKIQPLQYEKARKELVYNFEAISETTTSYFFSHALNQVMYDMALKNSLSSDTLYQMGQERHKIGKITQADLLTLRLNAINAQNDLSDAAITLDKSAFSLASYLRYSPNTQFDLELAEPQTEMYILPEEALMWAKENNPKIPELILQILSAEQNLDQVIKSSRFSASVSASVGFNQAGSNISNAYHDLLRQDMVSLSFTIPILDWGVNKGKVNVARSNLNTALVSRKQAEEAFEQEVVLAVKDFNRRYKQIISADEARNVAEMAYEATYQRFFIGKTDVDGLNLALNRRTTAQRAYISALHAYWSDYYKIRRYTLHDFVRQAPISYDYSEFPSAKIKMLEYKTSTKQ